MAKTWVLDTDTKGTGAEMIPLEKVLERKGPAAPKREPSPVRRRRRRREPCAKAPEPAKPRRARQFKVVDVMTRRVLGERLGIGKTLELLGQTRSMVDVKVYVWDREARSWRHLTLAEQKLLWDRAATGPRVSAASPSRPAGRLPRSAPG